MERDNGVMRFFPRIEYGVRMTFGAQNDRRKGGRLVLERSEGMTSEGVTMTIEWKEIME